jgi:hypothetical protein
MSAVRSISRSETPGSPAETLIQTATPASLKRRAMRKRARMSIAMGSMRS